MRLSFKSFIFILISLAVGITFIYSAYTKLFPIQSFEYTIVQYGHLPWLLAAIAARFFIGLEAALGLLLALQMFGNGKWVIKTALALLILFSGYLIYLWAIAGNNVNCGCFGDAIWMSPSTSLIKNGILIVLLIIILKLYPGLNFKQLQVTSIGITVLLLILPFILYGLPDQSPTWLKKDKFQLDLTNLYDTAHAKPIPYVDLHKGKHVIAFLSVSCPHCRMAARKMHIMNQNNPLIPFYFVIAGKNEFVQSFWDETKTENIPHSKLDADSFTGLIGYSWPVIYWVNNDTVVANSNYVSLSQEEIEKWLSQP